MRKTRIRLAIALILGWLLLGNPLQAQEIPAQEFYTLLNQARLQAGLSPLGWSTRLAEAAQRHASDLAANRLIQSEGSDGSTYRQRIRDAGYRAWNEGLTVYETLWVGLGGPTNAISWFQANTWDSFSDTRYREIGVGYATDNQGVRYFVVSLGVRPNVLPIFINDGAATADAPQVAVRLTNEDAEPLGEGNWIGKAIEVRLSNTPQFEDAVWQPWSELLPWELAETQPGEYAVYAEFRDGAGRIAQSQDTIRLVATGEAQPTAVAPGTPEPVVTPTETLMPTSVATEAPIETPTEALPTLSPEASVTPFPQATPLPQATAIAGPTPRPTWTPLAPTAYVAETPPVDWPLWLMFILQGCALLLGLAAFLKRR